MDDEVESETRLEVSESFRINRKEISSVWKYFTKIDTDKDGFEKAACNYCAAEYVVGRHPKTGSSYGTSHLGRHILGCKINKLYEEYASNLQGSSSSHSLSSNKSSILHKSNGEGSRSKKSKLYIKEFEMFESESMYTAGKSELDLYLDEPKVKFGQGEDFDVLNYLKINESRFPTLSIMARDVLSIPITTVASESAFSIGGRVLNKYRSSTLPENLQMLICTRNWLHGFALNHNDEDDCKITHREALTSESQGASRTSN